MWLATQRWGDWRQHIQPTKIQHVINYEPLKVKLGWGPKASEGSPGFLRPQEAREAQGVRGARGEGNKAHECDWGPKAAQGFGRLARLPEAPGRSQEAKEAQGVGSEGEQGEQGPKGAKGFRRLPGLSEAPGRSQGAWEAQRARGVGQGVRGARGTRPLSLTEAPRLPKALEGSQGFLRPR